jgi:ABC-type oligopeptide transport system ATPase subunit
VLWSEPLVARLHVDLRRQVSDRVAVMHDGELVELADAGVLHAVPRHEYTRTLLTAVPVLA